MTKKLNVDQITSELEGSAFFRDARQRHPKQPLTTEEPPRMVADQEPSSEAPTPPVQLPQRRAAGKPANPQDAMLDSYQATTISRYQDINVDGIRRTVKDSGKEASILRISPQEKEALSEVLYQCKRRGLKTTETQLVRIAIAALLQDYDANQDTGILVRVLQALKE